LSVGVATDFDFRSYFLVRMLFSRQRLSDFVASSRDERTIRPDCSDATSQTCATPQISLSAQLFVGKFSENVGSEEVGFSGN
tara:strand:+ start:67171 stop:67416 length:246 start_codon:yes stop_codon:yes gene_type:complete